ncbi:TlpA disulfide reductase family protein [Enteractinococcus fodinae]|uniref:Thiol-disulfide isomerase/thioredoxin n=1 Tax=Enteractinococcus fodinae TaxID=684663 RepID=A0ABU2AY91_9MICC|nr:TlpA disulfide reductase family protein [Enteractinococcus fodinae]MDR7346330.1 thiol-disulfide isomerase/thioredoxin [Enteractinococcus fodinae]
MRNKTSRALIGLAIAGSVLFTACSGDDPLAAQAGNSGGKNYIAGDGSVMELAIDERSETVEFSGETFTGETISADTLDGPALVNFWYASCAPCRVEAPDLAELSEQYADDVTFVGVNVRDGADTAAAFERNFNIDYPSIEGRDGKVLLDFADYVPPQAVPTTLILDDEGRVAARVLGAVERSTLNSLLSGVVEE